MSIVQEAREKVVDMVADALIVVLGGPSRRRINSLPDPSDTDEYRKHVALMVPEGAAVVPTVVKFDVAAAPGTPVMQEVKSQ